MAVHVIVGYGAIGRGAAALLAGQGHEVRVVTRSGGPGGEPENGAGRIEHLALDASDAAALTAAADAAAVIYNCASPAYHRWARDWPPLSAALLAAAERTGAVLATVSNLYGYGPVTGPMTEQLPLAATGRKGMARARMWQEALAAHRAGRARVTEVRASDYIGPGAQSLLGDRVLPRLLAGRGVQVTGRADTPHTWTYVGDVARLLVTAGGDERAWGRPWHVPSGAPRTQREAIGDLAGRPGSGRSGSPSCRARCWRWAGWSARCCGSCPRWPTRPRRRSSWTPPRPRRPSAWRRRRGMRSWRRPSPPTPAAAGRAPGRPA
jgi:nucleoside-diphosphate-sugar epimerase